MKVIVLPAGSVTDASFAFLSVVVTSPSVIPRAASSVVCAQVVDCEVQGRTAGVVEVAVDLDPCGVGEVPVRQAWHRLRVGWSPEDAFVPGGRGLEVGDGNDGEDLGQDMGRVPFGSAGSVPVVGELGGRGWSSGIRCGPAQLRRQSVQPVAGALFPPAGWLLAVEERALFGEDQLGPAPCRVELHGGQ